MPNSAELLDLGVEAAQVWCKLNNVPVPDIKVIPQAEWRFNGTCAFYRPTTIRICLEKCARPGVGGRAWSWPGYSTDRTPHGVILHELGHHVDMLTSKTKGAYFGDFSKELRSRSGEHPLTSYCPDDGEWFAEMFRLFVANPDLLWKLRPRTNNLIAGKFNASLAKHWRDVLIQHSAPPRYFTAVEHKL